MAIITRAQLRKWFGKGKYPTAAQFSDAWDSFWHKNEDKIAITGVDGLAEQLNGKLSAADGQKLKETVEQTADDLAQHKKESDEAIGQLRKQLNSLRSVVENDCVQRTTRITLQGGSPADLAGKE
ncbi:MAG: hypothetical protein V8Q54_03300 [Alistipes senegalensis]